MTTMAELIVQSSRLNVYEYKLTVGAYADAPDVKPIADLADISFGLATVFSDSPWLKGVGGMAGAVSFSLSAKLMFERASGGVNPPNHQEAAAFASEALSFVAQATALLAEGVGAAPAPQLKAVAIALTAVSTVLDYMATKYTLEKKAYLDEQKRLFDEKLSRLVTLELAATVALAQATEESYASFGSVHDKAVEKLDVLADYHHSAGTTLSLLETFRRELIAEINKSGFAVEAETQLLSQLPQQLDILRIFADEPVNFNSLEASYSLIVMDYSEAFKAIVDRYAERLEVILSRDGFLLKNYSSDGADVILATTPHDVLDGGAGDDVFDLDGIAENKIIYDTLGNNKIRIAGALVGTLTRAMQDGSPIGAEYLDEAGNRYSIVPSQRHDLSSDLIITLANGAVVTVVRWSESPGRFGIVLTDGEPSELPLEPQQSTEIFTVGTGAIEVLKDHELVVKSSYDDRENTRGTKDDEGRTLDQSFINAKEIVYDAALFPGSGGAFEGADLNDRLLGNNNFNELTGRDGDDYIDGRGGNDLLVGGRGSDYILGGEGKNFIYLEERGAADSDGNSNDYALGGSGVDLVSGGGPTIPDLIRESQRPFARDASSGDFSIPQRQPREAMQGIGKAGWVLQSFQQSQALLAASARSLQIRLHLGRVRETGKEESGCARISVGALPLQRGFQQSLRLEKIGSREREMAPRSQSFRDQLFIGALHGLVMSTQELGLRLGEVASMHREVAAPNPGPDRGTRQAGLVLSLARYGGRVLLVARRDVQYASLDRLPGPEPEQQIGERVARLLPRSPNPPEHCEGVGELECVFVAISCPQMIQRGGQVG